MAAEILTALSWSPGGVQEGPPGEDHEPYGVVAVMSPANALLIVPLYNLLSAVGAGNTVVLRPSSHAPAIAQRLVDLFDRAGAPADSIQLSSCAAEDAAWEFVENPIVRILVTYAGSAVGKDNVIKIGQYLARSAREVQGCLQIDGRMLDYVPELAGNDPLIVLAGADMDRAVDAAVVGAFAKPASSASPLSGSSWSRLRRRSSNGASWRAFGP
jgi:acyl-CoA reductase-like NAD-dependent aldehyde dehydrogenase